MLKNKFKIITLLTVIILALTLPVVRAENETADNTANSDVTTIENASNYATNPTTTSTQAPENNNSETTTESFTDENFKKSDVYLSGDNVTVDYIVDGNLFIVANNVTINSQIGGDAFICANTVTVGENGYIFSNLFTFSKNVNINGVVYDLYAASENTTINGYVYRDIRVGSNTVNIFGAVGRNAFVDCVNLNFAQTTNEKNDEQTEVTSSHGIVNGNLSYTAEQEASIPGGAVTGETTFEKEELSDGNTIQKHIISLGTFLATVIVIWLLCLWLTPKFLKNTGSFLTTKKVLPAIGFGISTPIVGILLSILLFILGITSTLGLLLLILLFALMIISTSIFVIAINNVICDKLKIQKTIGVFGMLIVSAIVLWLISLIPYIGSMIGIVAIILGLGIAISSLVLKEKNKTTEKAEEKKEQKGHD